MMMSVATFVSAANFSDLSTDHWAYGNISTLVDEGTINGYEDGTFRPSKTVSRAEFVKMFGKWDQKYEGTYKDISSKHWAYDYIMWSGLEAENGAVRPDEAILRSEVINLIWKRNGSPKHNMAPMAIINQGTNPDATSWAYTIGLMKGDDGLNLRLDSSLTRAEAATLIVRSRELVSQNAKNNFVDVVNEELLEKTYNSLALLDEGYDADRVLTYGELARMAVAFGADGSKIHYSRNDYLDSNNEVVEQFEHKYTKDMLVMCSKVWGMDYYKVEVADKPATVQDAVTAIMHGFMRRSTAPSDLGKMNNYYSDCVDAKSTSFENLYLTYANLKGIKLYAGDKLGANEEITVKKYAALMVQFNEAIGLGVGYSDNKKINVKMGTNSAEMPADYADFKHTISGVPMEVYALKNDAVIARNFYIAMNEFGTVYSSYMMEVAANAKNATGRTLNFEFYPALSYKQDDKIMFTAKVVLKEKAGEATSVSFDELFKSVIKTPTNKMLEVGEPCYVVFETYEPLMGIYLPLDGAYVKSVYIK